MPDRRRAWARALCDAAPDARRKAAYADALDGIAALMSEDRRMESYLRDPSIPKTDKKRFLASALTAEASPGAAPGAPAGKEDPVFARFCELLVDKGRTALIPALAAVFRRTVDEEEGIARLEIEAAREPDGPTLRRINEAWTRSTAAKRTVSSIRIKPELIAGYRLRSGSVQIDYSVAGRLERLRRQLVRPLGSGSREPGRGEG